MAGEHLGSEQIGGFPVAAAGNGLAALFSAMKLRGAVHWMDLVLGGTLISTGGAFNATNPTGSAKKARSGDDSDKLLDFIFSNIGCRIDGENYLFKSELASIVRTKLSELTEMDPAEVTGALVDGTSIPVSTGAALAFTLRLKIPVSLRELEEVDGDAYKQGSEIVRLGQLEADIKNVSGSVTLAGGTATLAGLTCQVEPHVDPDGDPYYVGPTYQVKSHSGLTSVVKFGDIPRGKRLFLSVDGVSGGSYTTEGTVKRDKQTAASINSEFNRNRRTKGGDNTTNRSTILIFPRRGLTLAEKDYTPRDEYVKDEGGSTPLLLSTYHVAASENMKARAVQLAKQLRPNAQPSKPTPPSAAATGVHTRNASILGQHIKG